MDADKTTLIEALRDLAWEAATEPSLRTTTAFQEALDLCGDDFRIEVEAAIRREMDDA